jgi:hypothetical protein
MNVLRNSVDNIRRRFHIRVMVLIINCIGYNLIFQNDWKLGIGIFIVNIAGGIIVS